MRTSSLVAAAFLASMITGAVSAQSFTLVGSVDVTAFDNTPTAVIQADNSSIFVGTFDNRRVLRVSGLSNPATATISTFLTTVTGDGTPVQVVNWQGAGAGITSLDINAAGDLLVSGSASLNAVSNDVADGALFIVNSSGTLLANIAPELDGPGTFVSATSGVFWGTAGQVVMQFRGGTNFFALPSTLDSFAFVSGGGFGTFGPFGTDAVVWDSGNQEVLLQRGQTWPFDPADLGFAGDRVVIRRYNGSANPNVFDNTGAVGSGSNAWFTYEAPPLPARVGRARYGGIGLFEDGTNAFAMLPLTEENRVLFVNLAQPAPAAISFDLAVNAPIDAALFDNGSDRLLVVTQEGGTIAVFNAGPASTADWHLY